ncbi:hypothetical protein LIS04_117 [Listeria phage LIS04]|nr:hypothetical protein LIS04_117 [Listeria phage LIS04]
MNAGIESSIREHQIKVLNSIIFKSIEDGDTDLVISPEHPEYQYKPSTYKVLSRLLHDSKTSSSFTDLALMTISLFAHGDSMLASTLASICLQNSISSPITVDFIIDEWSDKIPTNTDVKQYFDSQVISSNGVTINASLTPLYWETLVKTKSIKESSEFVKSSIMDALN